MLVVDEVAKGKLNLTDRFDITNTYYEYVGEHDNYVAAFDGAMSIPDMQRYSLVYSCLLYTSFLLVRGHASKDSCFFCLIH